MFGSEPAERWTREEAAEFENYVAKRDRRFRIRAICMTVILGATVLLIGPFLKGHSLHSYRGNFGKYLLLLAMAELLLFVYFWGLVYASWQSAKETRREME